MAAPKTVELDTILYQLINTQMRAQRLNPSVQRGIWHLLRHAPAHPLTLALIGRPDAPADLLAEYATLSDDRAKVGYLCRPEHTTQTIRQALNAEPRIDVLVRLMRADVHIDAVLDVAAARFLDKPSVGLAEELLRYEIDTLPAELIDPLWRVAGGWLRRDKGKHQSAVQSLARRLSTLGGDPAVYAARQVRTVPSLLVMFAGCPDLPDDLRLDVVHAMANVIPHDATVALAGLLSINAAGKYQELLDQMQSTLNSSVEGRWRAMRDQAAAAGDSTSTVTQRLAQAENGNPGVCDGLVLDPDVELAVRVRAAGLVRANSSVYRRMSQLPEPVLDALVLANPAAAGAAGVWQWYPDPDEAQARAVTSASVMSYQNGLYDVLKMAGRPAALRAMPWKRVPFLPQESQDGMTGIQDRVAELQHTVLGDHIGRWELFAGLCTEFDGTFGDLLDLINLV